MPRKNLSGTRAQSDHQRNSPHNNSSTTINARTHVKYIVKYIFAKIVFNKLNRLVWQFLVSHIKPTINYPKGGHINNKSFHVLSYETVPWKVREMGFQSL